MRLDDRTRRIIIPLMLAALCSGCVSSSVDGPAVTYHYSLWWAFCILPAFLSTVPIGLLVRKRNTLYGWLIIAAGAASVVAFAPIAFQESVLVDPGGFHVRSGFWGMTARLDVAIDAVQSIAVVQEDTGGRHSPRQRAGRCPLATVGPSSRPDRCRESGDGRVVMHLWPEWPSMRSSLL